MVTIDINSRLSSTAKRFLNQKGDVQLTTVHPIKVCGQTDKQTEWYFCIQTH